MIQNITTNSIGQGWAINLTWEPLSEGRNERRAKTYGNRNKSRFKFGSALTFAVLSWRIFQIRRFSWMLPRATENAMAGHIWPAGRYLPTPGI